MFHVSSIVVLSPSREFLREHFFFFTCLSYHTPRTLSASRKFPSSLSRQVAPSRITLAWRPAEWRKPAHHNSHRLWAQRTCDCLKERSFFWRSNYMMYRKKFEKKITELLSPKKWENWERFWRLACQILKISETSHFQSQTHFCDSVESTADSDLEDGKLQKMLTSPLCA